MRIARKSSNPKQETQPLTYVQAKMEALRKKYLKSPKLGWNGGYNLKSKYMQNGAMVLFAVSSFTWLYVSWLVDTQLGFKGAVPYIAIPMIMLPIVLCLVRHEIVTTLKA